MSNSGRTFAQTRSMLNFYLTIHWHVPYERSNFPVISKVILPSSLLFDDFESFLPGYFYVTFGRAVCTLTSFNRSFTTFEYRSRTKSLCSLVELPLKTVFAYRCNFPDSEANLHTKVVFLAENHRLHITRTTINIH